MQTTIFTHFLNEEILLPSWLNHHRKLFSHGVLLDWGSSDNSIDIISSMCPTWEIIKFKKDEYHGNACTWKIEELEGEKTGWKCALNVGEYLVIDNLENYLVNFEKTNPYKVGIRATGLCLVEESKVEKQKIDIYRNQNMLAEQRFGYLEFGKTYDCNIIKDKNSKWIFKNRPIGTPHAEGVRNRLLHKYTNGCYNPGRHTNRITDEISDQIFVSWIGRGQPNLYIERTKQWNNSHDVGVPNLHPIKISELGDDYFDSFYEWEFEKSCDIFKSIPLYEKYINTLYPKNSNMKNGEN